MLVIAVFKDMYLIMHIGDGVIGYLDSAELKIASLPENGEFVNETTFLTSNEAIFSMRLFKGKINDIAGFVIMSDGTEQSLYHKSTKALAKAIIRLMQRTCILNPITLKKQLVDVFSTIIAKNTQDDCSIAILARPIGILRGYHDLTTLEKCEILKLCPESPKAIKKINWYNNIICFLDPPKFR